MSNAFQERALKLQERMNEKGLDFILLTHPDTVYYISAFHGDLGMDFGRPMIIALPRSERPVMITSLNEHIMAQEMTWIEDIRPWLDGDQGEWAKHLQDLFKGYKNLTVGIELYKTPPVVTEWLRKETTGITLVDVSDILGKMRMIKSPEEIEIMRQAGQVAVAMAESAAQAIGVGVPEYELALSAIAGGTRKAAEFLDSEGTDRLFSPTIHNLQVIETGPDTIMCHKRNSTRIIQKGDPVNLCFCAVAQFKMFKLGFDRTWIVPQVSEKYSKTYEITLRAQQAALDAIRPGVPACDVHAACVEVYKEAGFEPGYRTGRGIGYSFLENPQFRYDDKTLLQAGMTFCCDGGIVVGNEFGARVGDSLVVTETGHEILTQYPKDLKSLIIV
jgi:Xaa-Pro aminopeptidase